MSEIIKQHIKDLREHAGYVVELVETDGLKNVIIKDYPLPPGYTKNSSDLLIRLDAAYPNSKPDMFWLEFDVLLAGDVVPKSAEQPLDALDRKWRRFSWHLASWNPATGDLLIFLEFIDARLTQVE